MEAVTVTFAPSGRPVDEAGRIGYHRTMETDHLACVDQAVDFIRANLAGRLSVEEIADHCCFSRHYFNRLFCAVTGENINGFTRRLRLERAAWRLLKAPHLSVTDIATEAGYSPSNFATAFRDCFGTSASAYRETMGTAAAAAPHDTWLETRNRVKTLRESGDSPRLRELDGLISIRKLPSMFLYYRRFIGPYRELGPAWGDFCGHAGKKFPCTGHRQFIGISYDDPLVTEEGRCIYDMCVEIDRPLSANCHRIPASAYACYDFRSHLDDLMTAFNELLGVWMPMRRFAMKDQPCLEIYHEGPDEAGKVVMDIAVPVEA